MDKRKIVIYWLPVLFCMVFIFFVSSMPAKKIPPLFINQDIAYHSLMYLLLAFLFGRALRNSFLNITLLKVIIFTTLFGLFYGATDEFHQLFVPGRSCSGFDLLIDTAGSFIGSLLCR
ncbi:MAG: VanZ family protein [Candidatus Omnitrophica bacterium]|nr:VanZ family protein [Candidatus Omnitrophota bacterium]MBU1869573.1 VanZ family protein [Candidatus Omnitrophota bacterium]